MKKLVGKYLVYVVYFLGIGMTSSGVVLMPFNHVRYSIILSIGLGLFLAGSIYNEIVIDEHKMSGLESIKLIVLSLTLALGIGMISGGISHFKESPKYVTFLIPMGIIISFISFVAKNNYKLDNNEKKTVYIGVVLFALLVFVILFFTAGSLNMNMSPGGDIFKGGH